MSFYIFKNGDIANKSEMNANVYHVFEGELIPRGGNYLNPTDSAYNLGTDTNRWKSGHFNYIDYTTMDAGGTTWVMISDYEVITTETSISFSFSGSLSSEYEIIMRASSNLETVKIVINEVSVTAGKNMYDTYYEKTEYTGTNMGPLYAQYNTCASDGLSVDLENLNLFMKLYFFASSGNMTFFSGFAASFGDVNSSHIELRGACRDTAVLTGLKINGSFNPGTYIQLWSQR